VATFHVNGQRGGTQSAVTSWLSTSFITSRWSRKYITQV